MMKRKHINHYKFKLRANKVNYSITAGLYKNTNDMNVTFRMT